MKMSTFFLKPNILDNPNTTHRLRVDRLQTHSPLVNKLGQSLLHDANLVYTRKEDEDAAALGNKQTVVFVGSATKTRPNNCCMTA